MSFINDFSYGTYKYHKKLTKLAEPLEQILGPITECGYLNISKEKGTKILINQPGYLERYIQNRYYIHDHHFIDPTLLSNGLSFWFTQPDKNYQNKLIYDGRQLFDIGHGFTYTKKITSTNCEHFLIASSNSNYQFYNNVLNNSYVIDQFSQYFKSEIKNIINELDDYSVNILKPMGFTSDKQQPIITQKKDKTDIIKFLLAINAFDNNLENIAFSEREMQCASLLLQGKTARETAQIINLSSRTVEDYINAIKNKLNCHYKKDLISKLNILNKAGLF
jgi:DNA-binding CsgD family transcriptional regulator